MITCKRAKHNMQKITPLYVSRITIIINIAVKKRLSDALKLAFPQKLQCQSMLELCKVAFINKHANSLKPLRQCITIIHSKL